MNEEIIYKYLHEADELIKKMEAKGGSDVDDYQIIDILRGKLYLISEVVLDKELARKALDKGTELGYA